MSSETAWLAENQTRIEGWIADDLARPEPIAGRIVEAMRYSALAGGKRLRPLLMLASASYLSMPVESIRLPALAIEYIHTYSLIHDDLPAMDNDDVRRGKPTNHKIFGDALAILAGDALLTEAFLKMAEIDPLVFPPRDVLRAIRGLAEASGAAGLVAGQTADLAAEHQSLTLAELEALHLRKTGALFEVACQMPAWLGGDEAAAIRLRQFGTHFGLAFQIVDDILNEVGDAKVMGKSTGTDRILDKATYPRLLGIEQSWRLARQQQELAAKALTVGAGSNNAGWLLYLLNRAVDRSA
jgi:geranylgeranyl diphosphate synthase type II